jgi:prepilin-type N-terminal cleavage/methylation domain-containing protein
MKNINKKLNSSNQGFTLIEVLVAIVVLTIGVLSLYAMQVSTINSNATAKIMTHNSNWASDRIEILISRPYDCSPFMVNCHDLDDVNGDGTNQDADNNGIDDSGGNSIDNIGGIVVGGNVVDNAGGNFGLNDGLIYDNTAGLLIGVNPALADHRITSSDGQFTILWNVAVDTPVPHSKTIRVIVTSQDRGVTKAVPMTYIKADKI